MPSEQNRQSRPTGTVPKAKTRRESVPREIVTPMRRDLQRNNIPNNLVLVDWQQPATPAQPVRNIRSRKPHTRSPGEGICFDQVPDSAVHFDHNWLPVVRPQLRSHKRGQAQGSNNMSSLGNNLGTHSSNTAIVMPTTPNAIHPVPTVNGNGLSRNESGGNNNSRNQQEWDVGATSRVPDGAPQQSRPERLQVEDRLGQIREYIEITSNLMNTVSETGESTDEENANLLKMLNDLKDSETKLEQLLVLSFNTVSEKEKPAIFENNNSNDIIVTEIESDDNDYDNDNDSYIQQRKETLENIIDGVDGDLSDLCDAMEADQLHNEMEKARSDSSVSEMDIILGTISENFPIFEFQIPEQRVESGQNLNNSLNSSSLRCDELRQKMSMSQRKIQLLQNQHSELVRIQESAKKELAKLNKLKETESHPSSQRVYMLQPQQLNSNSNEFSFQPMYNQQILDNDLNPISDGDHNNLNTSNGSYPNSENYHYPNQQNPTSDVNHPLSMTNSTQNSIDVSMQNINMNYNPNSNSTSFSNVNSMDVPHSNEVNLLSNNVAIEAASANEFNLSDNMSNISQRLIAVDALMQSRAEAQRMNNGYRSEQNLYEDKLRELHSKKQQMDSLVADLHSLKNQSPNSLQQQQQQHELQQLDAPTLQELESIQQKLQIRSRQQQQQLQTLQQQQQQFASIEQQQLRGHLESESGSDVECEPEPEGHSDGEPIINNEIAQINVMKAQLARLKTMMDTMNYIEAHAAGSNSQASSHQGSVGEPASPISRPNNYAESWNGSIKVNNVQDFGRQVADRGDGMGDMSLDGMSLEAVQAMTQDLRNQAIALAAERDRLVAQGQMVTRNISVERPLSSNGQTENKPEKRTNQTSGAIQSGVPVRPQRPLVGPREQQQMLLKAELEAKKRDLEHLMRKDRDQTSAINQDTCSVSGTIKSDAGYSISGEPAWSSLQRAGDNAVSTTGKVNCISMESLDIPVNQSSRSDHRDNNEINQENIGLSSDNTRSNTVNSTSAIPPPMPTLNWRKNSTDSALGRWNCESASNLQGSVATSVEMGAGTTSQQQQQWWQNKAMQLQNQLELTTNLCNSMLQAQSLNNPSNLTRNTSTPINQTPTLTTAYPLATNYPLTAATNIPVAHATFPHLPPVLQLGLVNNESFYQQCMNAQTQQMMLASMTQCYQLLWMQQRELANLGTAVMTLQDRILNMSLNDAASSTLLAPTAPRALSSYPTQAQQTLSAGGTPRRSPVKMTQSQTSAPAVAPVANSNLTNSHSIPVLSHFTHNENTQMRHDVTGINFNSPNLNNQTNFANISPGNSAQNFYHNPNVNNLNQIPFDNVSNFNNSVGVPSKPNLFQNESVCIQNNTNPNSLLNLYQNQHVLSLNSAGIQSNQTFQSPSTSHAQVPTLNNQVPPGNRANNYWDNFRRNNYNDWDLTANNIFPNSC